MDALEALNKLVKKYGSRATLAEKMGYKASTPLLKNGEIASQAMHNKLMKLYQQEFSETKNETTKASETKGKNSKQADQSKTKKSEAKPKKEPAKAAAKKDDVKQKSTTDTKEGGKSKAKSASKPPQAETKPDPKPTVVESTPAQPPTKAEAKTVAKVPSTPTSTSAPDQNDTAKTLSKPGQFNSSIRTDLYEQIGNIKGIVVDLQKQSDDWINRMEGWIQEEMKKNKAARVLPKKQIGQIVGAVHKYKNLTDKQIVKYLDFIAHVLKADE